MILRKQHGVPLVRIARLCHVCVRTVRRFEKGEGVGPDTYSRISKAYLDIRDDSITLAETTSKVKWLRRQVEVFLRENANGFYEKGEERYPVITEGQIYDLCRLVLTAAGIDMED